MYTHWTKITERDLIQKGASYKRIKTTLKLEKIVLNMTLPNIGSSIPTSGKSSSGKDTSMKQLRGSGGNQIQEKKGSPSGDRESIINLSAMSLLAVISGQRPILTKARKSIANWKIRKNQVLGFKVTLRGKLALDFLDKTVRFQNLNEQDLFTKTSMMSQKGLSEASSGTFCGNYTLQSLGNLSVGIKNLNLYPELEDLWIAQNLGSGGTSSKMGLGLDLSLNFKNNKESFQLLNSIKRKPGGKKLIEDYFKKIQAFPVHMKTNKAVLSLKNLLILRQLYLTSLGLFPKLV